MGRDHQQPEPAGPQRASAHGVARPHHARVTMRRAATAAALLALGASLLLAACAHAAESPEWAVYR